MCEPSPAPMGACGDPRVYPIYILPNDIQKKDYNMKIGAGPAKRSEVRRVYILAQARARTRTIWHAVSVKWAPSQATQMCNVSCFSANSAMWRRSARLTFFPSDATTALAFWVDHYWMHAISTMPRSSTGSRPPVHRRSTPTSHRTEPTPPRFTMQHTYHPHPHNKTSTSHGTANRH